MLQYMGTRQPPRKYPIPEGQPTTPAVDPCIVCLTRIWTPELFSALSKSPLKQESYSRTYTVTSQELRKSVLEGCKFCRTIADGIHGKVFLDELYERWNKTDSYPESPVSDNEDCAGPEYQASDSAQAEAEGQWNDASVFNEEEFEDDVTGGWDAWEDRDTLVRECMFRVELSFDRGEAGLFTFVNARIEATGEKVDEGNEPQKLRGDKVEVRYHINMDGRESQNASRLFPTWTSNSALGSDVNMSIFADWMRKLPPTLDASDVNPLQVPARLIELQNNNGLRIVDTSTLPHSGQSFAALSYVWGTNQTFVLLSTTKDSLITRFEAEQLPKTIQDVVTVTRRIGLRYLWVDALCIMQDSNKDKARELPKMRLIYKCAAVTIVAAVAKSATEGFLHYIEDRTAYFIEPVTIPYRTEEPTLDTHANVNLNYPADYKRAKDPINDRAWTFQELLLSTRAILFSYRGIQMIDRTNIPVAGGLSSGKDPQLPSLPWSGQMFSLATNPEDTRQVWLAARGEYSRRSLTYQGDKLPAIAAVAEELGHKYNSRYLAGMWERDLAMDLQWSCPRDQNTSENNSVRKPRAEGYVAPSWSWASVDASVEDFVLGIKDFLGFEVISCKVELAVPHFTYGAVRSGTLVVKGRLCSFVWRAHKDDEFHRDLDSDGFLARATDDATLEYSELMHGEATIDALDPELQEGSRVICLATRLNENVPGRDDVEGLMLLPADDGKYRRVGFFKLNGPAMFEKCEVEEVTII